MCQTLFTIPHQIGPLTTFGVGWALIAWCVFSLFMAVLTARAHGTAHGWGTLPFALIVAAVIVFVLPKLEVERTTWDGQTHFGIQVRGFGVMLLIAVVSGVVLAIRRARQRGLAADWILRLATWMLALGIVGARLFYIIQYWDHYQDRSLAQMIGGTLNVSQGGLVVYGSLIGALLGFGWFVYRHQLPGLALADMVAPALLLGLALGRIGCFLNGCCYGGPSDLPWAVQFPPASVPYAEQLRDGTMHGFHWHINDQNQVVVDQVDEHSRLAAGGLRAGDVVTSVNGHPVTANRDADVTMGFLIDAARAQLTITTQDGRDVSSALDQLPDRTTPLHPTQLYSSLTALLLCLFLLAAEPFLTRSGQLFALLLTLYPIARFLLEMIRTDEGSFGATGMTISQNISLLLLAVAVGLWLYLAQRPPGHYQLVEGTSARQAA